MDDTLDNSAFIVDYLRETTQEFLDGDNTVVQAWLYDLVPEGSRAYAEERAGEPVWRREFYNTLIAPHINSPNYDWANIPTHIGTILDLQRAAELPAYGPNGKRKAEDTNTRQTATIPTTKGVERIDTSVFPGFAPERSLILMGTTDNGKTDSVVSWLIMGLFKTQYCIYVAEKTPNGDATLENLYKGLKYHLHNPTSPPCVFEYYLLDQLETAWARACQLGSQGANPLLFVDDFQGSTSNVNKVATGLRSKMVNAKNMRVQLLVVVHNATDADTHAKALRSNATYQIGFNLPEPTFKLIFGPTLWPIYNTAASRYNRVIILDTKSHVAYWGSGKMLEMIPIKPNTLVDE